MRRNKCWAAKSAFTLVNVSNSHHPNSFHLHARLRRTRAVDHRLQETHQPLRSIDKERRGVQERRRRGVRASWSAASFSTTRNSETRPTFAPTNLSAASLAQDTSKIKASALRSLVGSALTYSITTHALSCRQHATRTRAWTKDARPLRRSASRYERRQEQRPGCSTRRDTN